VGDEQGVADGPKQLGAAERWALLVPLRDHMLAVARRRCASDEDAEDCVHEAMLRVAQFDKLDPARIEALLTSITTRLAVDQHRARAREQRYQPRLVHVPAQQAPPDEAALDAGEAVWLAAQVHQLPERERDVFRQRAAGYSVPETAARLALSYKSVESAFTRARGRMRNWAGAGVLLIAEYLRRLRTRSASAWASMAMVSAGCVILSALPSARPQTALRSIDPSATMPRHLPAGATSATTTHVQAATAPPRPHAGPAAMAHHTASRIPAGSTPAIPSQQEFRRDIPVGDHGGGVTVSDTQYTTPSSPVDDVVACVQHPALDPHKPMGCPPQ
jgi:RNA polymerase sigma factor (sigma-70 family)